MEDLCELCPWEIKKYDYTYYTTLIFAWTWTYRPMFQYIALTLKIYSDVQLNILDTNV